MSELKTLSYNIDVDLPDRGIRVSSFTVRYMPTDSQGLPSGVFDHVYINMPNSETITFDLEANGTYYAFQGFIDSCRVLVDPVYIAELSGRDKFAVLLEKSPPKELKYLWVLIPSNLSAHAILSDIIYAAGLVPYFSFPDYQVYGDIVLSPQESYANAIQNLIAPFQLGRKVTVDVYTEENQVYIVKRNYSSPARGSIDISVSDILSIEFTVEAPQMDSETASRIRLEGARIPQLKPCEEGEEWETSYRKTVEQSVSDRTSTELTIGGSVEHKQEREETSDENGTVTVVTDYTISKDGRGRAYLETYIKDYLADVADNGSISPPFRLPPDREGDTAFDWRATEQGWTVTEYWGESDRKKIQFEYRSFSFNGLHIAAEWKLQAWTYDDCGDVFGEAEAVAVDRYDDEGNYRLGVEKRASRTWYYNEGAYKVRRVNEYSMQGGQLRSRTFVERSPVRDETLLNCGGRSGTVVREEGQTVEETNEERRGGRRTSNSVREEFRETVDEFGVHKTENIRSTRQSESVSGSGYSKSEERSESVRTDDTDQVTSRQNSYSYSEKFEAIAVEGEVVTETVREERTSREEEFNQTERRARRVNTRVDERRQRPRRENEVSLDEPPPGYCWVEDVVAVGPEREEASKIYNVSPMADVNLMAQLRNELIQELTSRFVSVLINIKPNFNVKPGMVLRVLDAPTFWPVNRFYVVGLDIEGEPDGVAMRVTGYAWY